MISNWADSPYDLRRVYHTDPSRPNPFQLNILGPAVSVLWAANASGAGAPNPRPVTRDTITRSCGRARRPNFSAVC